MLELLKLIPDATSAIAVILVVVLFLRQQQAAGLASKAVAEEFTRALEVQRQAVVETINRHLAATSEMLSVVRALEGTVRHTNELVLDLQRLIHERVGLHYDEPGGERPAPGTGRHPGRGFGRSDDA